MNGDQQETPLTQVFVGLGSNLGDAVLTVKKAIQVLESWARPEPLTASSLWETRPVGPVAQAHFVNAAVGFKTTLPPEELMTRLLALEKEFGRVRLVRWGPRTLDLDLLFYGEIRMRAPFLTLPHPRIQDRGFVLAPLRQIAPDFVHPVLGQTLESLWQSWRAAVPDADEHVRLLPDPRGRR
jgi:2-amino-4-hydroxy-6-hydroxymethyldihydropteridine diphosphokinase